MKTLLVGLAVVVSAVSASSALAQSTQADWVEVTRNSVGDRFMVERNSIEARNGAIWYWEHRSFPEPNNALVEVELEQPVYSALLYRSVDCVGGVSRLRQIIVHLELISRFGELSRDPFVAGSRIQLCLCRRV